MHTSQSTPLPSLEDICIQVVSTHNYWIVQKRHLQYLPEDAANTLLRLLLFRGRLQTPSLLEIFRHSATRLHLNAKQLGLQLGAEWIAYIAGLGNLQQLCLQHAPRLKDKHLAPLTRLSNSLTSLDLTGCSSITNKACGEVLGQITALQSLVITGTGIRTPILQHLTQLSLLSHLDLGGCEVSNNELTCHITAFQHLQRLELWGSAAGDASVVQLNQLPHLNKLNMAWSQLKAVIPLHCGLVRLDLSHCQLEGTWHEIVGLLGAAGGMKLQELVMVHTMVSAAYGEVLEAMIRASSEQLQLLDLTALRGCDLLPLLLALEAATGLHSLSLSATGLADDFCPTLTPCSALQNLDLSQNPDVTAAGLRATVPVLQGLSRLNLCGTSFGDDGLEVLWGLPDLQQLVLADTAVAWEWTGPATVEGGSQQQQQESAATAAPGQSLSAHRGWRSLQVLDVSNSNICDAGCLQMAQQLGLLQTGTSSDDYTAAHSGSCDADAGVNQQPDMAGSGCSSSCNSGLLVLSIGSRNGSSSKVTKKGVAALGRIGTLQQLTLQHCQLQDRDLKHLRKLQQLKLLHVQHIDPWLLSNQGLQELADTHDLRQLKLVIRDGKTLYSVAAEMPWLGLSSPQLPGQLDSLGAGSQQQTWLQEKVTGVVGSTAGLGMLDASSSISSNAVVWPMAAASTPPARAATPGSSGNSRQTMAGSRAGATALTVYRRLLDFDERYKYSIKELLTLQAANTGDSYQRQQQEVWAALRSHEEIRANTGDRWR